MKENVGPVDRMVRSVVGPALLVWGYRKLNASPGRMAAAGAMIGGALLIDSAVTRVCPVNSILGIDTRLKRFGIHYS